ncbi:MAG: shikimate dehydrogenase, partial [Candidatus Omnitrophica bacterium]|nr:shikimate dehydrogenase [Candidatus Omnitrophota bacterium]
MVRLFGVIGHPVSHSRSPAMHAAALRALKLDAVYSAFDVPPRFLRPMLQAFVLAGVEGLNVTVPLKELVLPLLDRVDPVARAIGAVNTIVIRNRRLIGYNTDAKGFALALRQLGWRNRPAHAVILGAGGAAKAVAWQLTRTRGMQLIIANRHLAKAQRLARWIARRHPGVRAHAVPLARVRLDEAQLLINATTIGMRAGDPPPLVLKGLRRSALVYDVVYHRPT